MRAIQIADWSGPLAVKVVEIAEPPAPVDDTAVRVSVRAAGVTFAEVLHTRGKYQVCPDLPFTPGGEIAGVVDRVPFGSDLTVGDRVFGYSGLGGFADFVWLPRASLFPLANDLSFVEGAALFANFHTAWFTLVDRGRAVAGESVLVHGAGGGLGTACIQVAHALGLTVLAVVSDESKAAVARKAGAEQVLIRTADWRERVQQLMPGGVDIVIDPVGGEAIDNLRVLRELGRLMVVGFAGGEIAAIPANRLLLRNLEAIGVVYGTFAAGRSGYSRATQSNLDRLLADGMRPIIGATYPLADTAQALAAIDERRSVGKVVIEVAR